MTPEEMNIALGLISVGLTMVLGYVGVKYRKFAETVDFLKTFLRVIDDYEVTSDELKELIEKGKSLIGKDDNDSGA